ncbi:bifunctional diaminohydroxyphosphoribosylaminopyrimidine deaminase/5-amino-6-(5-phosphoribosylamino)uracil reductase RibD [Akkermansiaceae bacterium]|nr:bifunctional diaminohydroxyphosphoribosylaminopyrimidine deaminase/5-amino-6-(5-phosphoribosylamino)uracil reductase RibD [Akkermansiaceae bacterium]MDA7612383.1 bifunctional diaminohydroxyphosphoribosylaminopyrimidine deaminase/5-amino-6-(5-phosphoribosylamino)uracil reductase RibD [bacterium]MDA7508359.1 bifunctional diaminohydroxyphosphoribosylaminopyrimidine deaminase/5-amino-6-(5-phosphoribosylamino)uracil reductase RibD [Akkermansiaceae bacterium]MDA7530840.1 bifunctional diaminohydroxy
MKISENEKWIRIALGEGRKGIGLTAPNPPVGAVVVKDGVEIARGWHHKVGSPHAEKDALSKLKEDEVRGATVYVTLEPCSTHGCTGACTEALISAGVSKVVYGACDPNPSHSGEADKILEAAGIRVVTGILEEECQDLIRGFSTVQTLGRPWLIAKTAMSLDGRITRRKGEGQWLSGTEAREEVQELRSEADAILTSGETVRRDDPALTLRGAGISSEKTQPWRVVMTQQGFDKKDFQIFEDEWKERTLIFKNQNKYDVLHTLAEQHGVNTVLLEIGGSLLGSFLDEGLVDEWVIYLTPLVTGGPSVAVGGQGSETLEARLNLKNVRIHQVGRDICARGIVDRKNLQPLER